MHMKNLNKYDNTTAARKVAAARHRAARRLAREVKQVRKGRNHGLPLN